MIEMTAFFSIGFLWLIAYYKYKEHKLNTSQEETIEQIRKLAELLRYKSLVIDGELVKLLEWANSNFHNEITSAIIVNEKINEIREKCKLSDENFYSNMNSLTVVLINALTTRMQESKNRIEEEMIQEVKKLVKE